MTSPRPSGKALRHRFRWQRRFVSGGQARRWQTFGLLVVWILLVPRPLGAQEPGGRFLSVQGELEVLRGTQTLLATAQFALAPPFSTPLRLTLTAVLHLGRGEVPAALTAALGGAPTDAAAHAQALDPTDVRALVQATTLLFGMDRTEDAWALAQRAHTLAPTDALVLTLLGFLQLARGETDAALATFRQASHADPTLGEPHLRAGLALFRLGQVPEGLEALQTATLLDSQVSLFQSYLGKGLYQAGEREAGFQALARAAALDPCDPTPHLYRGVFLADLNRPAESIAALQTAIALNGEPPGTYQAVGRLVKPSGNFLNPGDWLNTTTTSFTFGP